MPLRTSSPAANPSPWLDPFVVLATCGWLGRMPGAPGTFGATLGVGLSLATGGLAERLAERLPIAAVAIELVLLLLINLVGIPICTRAAAALGLGVDPGGIVYDEAASLPLGLIMIPFAQRSGWMLVVAFCLHRVFDIYKPFPCRQLEHLPAGLGIMADDWGAAAWMAVCLAIGVASVHWFGLSGSLWL